MARSGLIRTLYGRASGIAALGRPLAAIRRSPVVRAYARRHLSLLLGRGSTWANVDGSLRLLAEDPGRQIVFGPWTGDATTELLYWAPFVRWVQEHYSLDPGRVVVASRGGVAHWYGDACGTYVDAAELEGDAFPGAVVFRPQPVLGLVERYRQGVEAPRPLLKRAIHRQLPPPDGALSGLPPSYVAVAIEPPAGPGSGARPAVEGALRALESSAPVVRVDRACAGVPPKQLLQTRHALLARATGLVTDWPGLAVLGALSGVPVLALRPAGEGVNEPDVDLAVRVAAGLGSSLTVLDEDDLGSLAAALGGLSAA